VITPVDAGYDVYVMIGNPVAQAKTPQIFNEFCRENGIKSTMVPMLIRDDNELNSFLSFVRETGAVNGFVSTVPHKIRIWDLIGDCSKTASLLKAVNSVRKSKNGDLYGAMFDGKGFIRALHKNKFVPKDKRAIIIGSGAAGRAIALELFAAGISDLAVVDPDPEQFQIWKDITPSLGRTIEECALCPDLSAFDLVVNASPLGMRSDDPLPGPIETLGPGTMVADTVTIGKPTAFLSLARSRGCMIQTGEEMAFGHLGCILDFFHIQPTVS